MDEDLVKVVGDRQLQVLHLGDIALVLSKSSLLC